MFIFNDMGFVVEEGFDIEDDFYNFMVLNFLVGYLVCELYDMFFFEVDEVGD